MRKAGVCLFGGIALAAVAFFCLGHGAQAEEPVFPGMEFSLRSMQPGFPLGGPAMLEVSVPPHAVGGFAHLYSTVRGETHQVLTFEVMAPLFPIAAPVPSDPALLGELLTFTATFFAPDGRFLGYSNPTRDPIVDPDWE